MARLGGGLPYKNRLRPRRQSVASDESYSFIPTSGDGACFRKMTATEHVEVITVRIKLVCRLNKPEDVARIGLRWASKLNCAHPKFSLDFNLENEASRVLVCRYANAIFVNR